MKLESQIETSTGSKLLKWAVAQKLPFVFLKINPAGQAGYPDRLLLWQGGILFVEFKRPGEKPTKLQMHRHSVLTFMGYEVRVYDNTDVAVREIQSYIQSTLRAETGHRLNIKEKGGKTVLASRKGENGHRVDLVWYDETAEISPETFSACAVARDKHMGKGDRALGTHEQLDLFGNPWG